MAFALRPIIDTVREPFASSRKPLEYRQAVLDLTSFVTNEEAYRRVMTIRTGCHSNHATHLLGKYRLAWLEDFHRRETGN
jgi:hypothetical protein